MDYQEEDLRSITDTSDDIRSHVEGQAASTSHQDTGENIEQRIPKNNVVKETSNWEKKYGKEKNNQQVQEVIGRM